MGKHRLALTIQALLLATILLLTACQSGAPAGGGAAATTAAGTAAAAQATTAAAVAAAETTAAAGAAETAAATTAAATDAAAPATEGRLDKSNLNDPGVHPTLKETVTLTIGVQTNTNVIEMETNTYTQMLQDGVNAKLEFEYFPAAGGERSQKLAVMISSNSELPDMISFSLTDLQTYRWGSQGYFIPLNDYLDELSFYLKPLMEEYDDLYGRYFYSLDGNLYALPNVIEDIGNDWAWRTWINQTWLDALGLDMPVTTDDFYTVMKAFKEQDPNGNGIADEIPLISARDNWAGSGLYPTYINAFTYVNWSYDCMQVENGKLRPAYTQDGWRQGLEWLSMLCAEGLLSPLTFTQDQNQLKQILENEDAQIVGAFTHGSTSIYNSDSARKMDMVPMPPLTGPDGIKYTNYLRSGLPGYFGFITKDCDDPVAAFMVFDYMYREDLSYHSRFGKLGQNWELPAPGDKSIYDSLGYAATVKYDIAIWGTMQNEFWQENHPTWRKYEAICGVVATNPMDFLHWTAEAVPMYMGNIPDEIVLRIRYTPDEADNIAEIKTALDSYYRENAVAFITGSRSLTDWDNYLRDLNNIGLEQYMEITQQAYERTLGLG